MSTFKMATEEYLSLKDTVLKLFDVEGLKFGSFVMRTGEVSPLYIDMRVIWTYPDLVVSVCEHMWKEKVKHNLSCEAFCGLPYQGIPLATYLSTKYKVPMLLKRKEPKQYGTKKFFEGHFKKNQKVLIIDDVLMTGGTLVEDIPVFREEGLEVEGTLAFIDRIQGGDERVQHLHGVKTYSVLKLDHVFKYLLEGNRVTQETVDKSMEYIRSNRFDTPEYGVNASDGSIIHRKSNECA